MPQGRPSPVRSLSLFCASRRGLVPLGSLWAGYGIIGVFLRALLQYSIPAYVVAYATQATFLVALLGITYSILSASWDEDVSE